MNFPRMKSADVRQGEISRRPRIKKRGQLLYGDTHIKNLLVVEGTIKK